MCSTGRRSNTVRWRFQSWKECETKIPGVLLLPESRRKECLQSCACICVCVCIFTNRSHVCFSFEGDRQRVWCFVFWKVGISVFSSFKVVCLLESMHAFELFLRGYMCVFLLWVRILYVWVFLKVRMRVLWRLTYASFFRILFLEGMYDMGYASYGRGCACVLIVIFNKGERCVCVCVWAWCLCVRVCAMCV